MASNKRAAEAAAEGDVVAEKKLKLDPSKICASCGYLWESDGEIVPCASLNCDEEVCTRCRSWHKGRYFCDACKRKLIDEEEREEKKKKEARDLKALAAHEARLKKEAEKKKDEKLRICKGCAEVAEPGSLARCDFCNIHYQCSECYQDVKINGKEGKACLFCSAEFHENEAAELLRDA